MKAYTDIEQSKKLAEMLPIESADHHYVRKVTDFMGNPVDCEWSYPKYGNPNSKYANYIVQNFSSYEKLPCWSLAALLGVFPKQVMLSGSEKDSYWYCGEDEFDSSFSDSNNPIDACYEMILKLHEQKVL